MNIYKDCIACIKKFDCVKTKLFIIFIKILYKKRLMPNYRSSTFIKVKVKCLHNNFFLKTENVMLSTRGV